MSVFCESLLHFDASCCFRQGIILQTYAIGDSFRRTKKQVGCLKTQHTCIIIWKKQRASDWLAQELLADRCVCSF